MEQMENLTELFSRKIIEIEEKRKKTAEILRQMNETINLDRFLERKIFKKVEQTKSRINIAGVDGGVVKTVLHGMDLILMRSVAVNFIYDQGKLLSTDYFPSSIPDPVPKIIFEPFSELEFEINSNMERQIMEIETTCEAIEKFKPDIILLDGSIIPHYTDRPNKASLIFPSYERMIFAYKRLFETAEKNNCLLAGVIEDSRGTRFCDLVSEEIIPSFLSLVPDMKILLQNTRDSNLLSYALNYSERTIVFPYSSDAEFHPVLKEFGEKSKFFHTFYLRTAELDRPVRVDFLSIDPVNDAEKISSILMSLSTHSSYGFPSVLIEADQRARLTQSDLQMFFQDLLARTGNLPGLFEQRRNKRPF